MIRDEGHGAAKAGKGRGGLLGLREGKDRICLENRILFIVNEDLARCDLRLNVIVCMECCASEAVCLQVGYNECPEANRKIATMQGDVNLAKGC